ncbi:hypothetical protein NEAUS03_0016 [Nematocida ausubeli]|nr:hypothetical protein NEAUS03_0016 [Nematocida ausubeli]
MKILSYIIWIKVVSLISVLLMGTHRADISLSEIELTLEFGVAAGTSLVKINPNGSLNFFRGYIYQKMECMYNKRFFAPQINTKYELKKESTDEGYEKYKYNRDRQMDRAYKALPTSKMDVYAEKYHNHLIELFPSPTGDITIEARSNQSFIQFLRAKTTEKHALQILAMLFLFSEGVDIPIKVTNNVLKVYETDKNDKIYFTVPMEIPWLNTKEERVEKFKQKKVKKLIGFFKENATNYEVLSMMVDKCSHAEISKGKFLDSPKFLIQSYIFGFIDTAQRATEFIQTVHTMTEKYAPKTEAPSKGNCVYDRLFKPASTETGTNCMALMKKTQKILNTYRVFPFANSMQLPIYTSVPWRNPITKEFSTDPLEDYSNCVECMILSLFCCLAYDPAEGIYRTDHMGDVSKELKEFFTPKENQIFDTTKAEFQIRWCTVVACLDEPRIAYCRDRNELDCGIINMLMVIAEIVNISKEKKDKIFGFSESLKEEEGVLENNLLSDIQEYTKALLKRLSKTENVEIEFSELKSNRCSGGKYDVYGKITISFKQSGIKNTIVLGISKVHSSINMKCDVMDFEDDRMEKLNEIAGICKSGTKFIENLFSVYINYEERKLNTSGRNKEFMKAQMHTTIENNFTDINRLLLIEKISSLDYKKELVPCSIVYSMDQELPPEHPIVRFTSNIIGSTELDNWEIQWQMLPSIMCAGLLNKNGSSNSYPNINLSKERHESIMRYIKYYNFIKYVLDCDISIFIVWIKYCIENFDSYNEKGVYELLLGVSVVYDIYEYIFKDQSMKYSDAIDETIERDYPEKKDMIISDLHYTWFIYLILEKRLNIELIKTNFDAIQTSNYIPFTFTYYNEQVIIQALTDLKGQLCCSKDSIARFDELIRQYKPDPATS